MNGGPPTRMPGAGLALIALLAASSCDHESAPEGHPVIQVELLPALDEVTGIRDLATTPSGSFWILNAAAPWLLLQDESGELVTAFGRLGTGPDEFGFPAAIVAATDTSVTVHDRDRNALRTFGVAGRESAALAIEGLGTLVPSDLDQVLAGSPFRTGTSGDGVVISDFPEVRASGTAHLWNRRIVRVTPDEGSIEGLIDFRDDRDRYSERLAGASVLVPAPLWAACGDGTIATYVPFRDSVTWVGRSGASVAAPRTPRPLEDEEVRAALRGRLESGGRSAGMSEAELEEAVRMGLEQLGEEMSSTAPAYVEMACDADGLVWLQHFSVEHDWMGRGRSSDLVDEAGMEMEDVALPPGFRISRFHEGTLLGVSRDEFGLERVAVVTQLVR